MAILGIGLALPPAVSVREYAASRGADVSQYQSWECARHARGDEDHPSTMASVALGQALSQSGVLPAELRLVVFTGVSRDYPPPWSVATEVMRVHGVSRDCIGLDLTIGCLATLSALDLVQGFLAQRGAGCAAIVAAERWSQTIEYSDPKLSGMWSRSDGGAALVVGMGQDRPAIADFLGAEFTSHSEHNGQVMIPYGGTRAPIAPPGVDPQVRKIRPLPRQELKDAYMNGYGRAYEAISRRLGLQGERLICNQLSPQAVQGMAAHLGIQREKAVLTGHQTGHLGACDVIIGLHRLQERKEIDAPILVGSSTSYGFGAGLLLPPGSWQEG